MKYKSDLITAASGSIGGACYQGSRGGLVRFAKPRNTRSSSNRQGSVRNDFTTLAIHWRQDLSQSQRDAWQSYAELTPIGGRLGDPLTLSGSQMFRRCNATRLAAALGIVDDGPTTPGLVHLTQVNVLAVITNPFIGWQIPNTDAWALETGGAMILQTSRFHSVGGTLRKRRLRQLAVILGSPGGPPAFLTSTVNAFRQFINLAQVGQPFFNRFVAVRADGRISSEQLLSVRLE